MAPRRTLGFLLSLALLAGSLAGCDEEDVEMLDSTSLDERFACGDLTVVAADSDGSQALLLGIDDGLAAEVMAEGVVVVAKYQLPDERLMLRWVQGNNVYQGQCGHDGGAPWRVEERHDAIGGEIAVRLEPTADGHISVLASLDGVLFIDDYDDEPAYGLAPTDIEAVVLPPPG